MILGRNIHVRIRDAGRGAGFAPRIESKRVPCSTCRRNIATPRARTDLNFDMDRYWTLMGRVTQQGRLFEDKHDLKVQFKLKLVQSDLRLEEDEVLERLSILVQLLPGFEARILAIQGRLLVALLQDVDLVALRMIELKGMLPDCDVGKVLLSRPSLVLDGEWECVPGALAALLDALDHDRRAVAQVVEQQPALLAEDIPLLLQELQRLMGTTPEGAAKYLRQFPDVVLSLQSGINGLGPAAEVDVEYIARWQR